MCTFLSRAAFSLAGPPEALPRRRKGETAGRRLRATEAPLRRDADAPTPNLPTKHLPTKMIAGPKIHGKSPMDMRIPPLKLKTKFESKPLQSRILVQYGDWL